MVEEASEQGRLEGKVAVVTGASSGIGEATCEKLAREGCDLCLGSRKRGELESTADGLQNRYGIETVAVSTDVREEMEVKGLIKQCMNHFDRLDILVNNAGIIRYGDIEEFPTEDYKAMMETNVDGAFFATREALPHLKETEGNLIFVGSFDANHPRSFNPIYASTKWWIKGFAHSIESIAGKNGVAVTLINPSEVRTAIKGVDGKEYKEKFDEEEVTDPEEVAEAIVFAAKQEKTTTLSQIDIYRRDKLSEFF